MPERKGKPDPVKVFTKWASLSKAQCQTPRMQVEWLSPWTLQKQREPRKT